MSLRSKLAFIVICSVLITILLLVSLLFVFSKAFLQGYTHASLQEISEEAKQQLLQLDEWSVDAVREVLERLSMRHPDVSLELLSGSGTPLYSSSGRMDDYSLEELAGRFVDQPHNLFQGKDVHLIYEMELKGVPYYLLLSVAGDSLMPVQIFVYFNRYSSLPFLFIPLLLITLLPSLAVLGFVIRVNRRIKKLNVAMQQADLHRLHGQVEDRSRDEIGQLARLFNAMSDKLSGQFARIRQIEQSRKELISNLSHDLRTPLTSIKGYAETLQCGKSLSASDLHRYASIIVQRAAYMDHLLNQLFEIAKLDELPQALQRCVCNISRLVQQIVMDYVYLLEDKGIEPDIRIPPAAVWVSLDEREVQQVVRNLVENVLQHGWEGHYLGISLEENEGYVTLAVRDRGKGIPAEEQGRIFERFYRMDKGRKSDGMGLGLAIAREIVERHHGRITLTSEPFVLTKFTVELPGITIEQRGKSSA
jgi:signal transduction histidine kinase